MKFLTAMSVLCFLMSACTPKSDQQSEAKTLPFDSDIRYIQADIEDPEQAADVAGSPVSWAQLLSQDVALQELQESHNKSVYSFVYGWGKMLAEKSDSPVQVELLVAPPETEIEKVLSQSQIEPSKKVEIVLKETADKSQSVLAQAGDQKLTWDNYIEANISHAKLYEKLFTQRMQRLNGVVIRRYLLEASKAAKLPMEAYVQKNIVKKEINPGLEDVQKFAQEKGISESDLDEKMVERLQDIVKQNHRDQQIEAFVAKNLIKEPVKVDFQRPMIKIKSPELTESIPQWGENSGPKVVFVGDWNCQNCSTALKSFLQTKNTWDEKVKGAFIYSFPDRDREARMGAEAALCVEEQSEDSFWVFLAKVIDVKEENIEERINVAAQASGVDFEKFRDCFLKRNHQQVVDGHLAYARDMGVSTGPLMVVQGQVFEPPFDLKAVDQKLKSLGLQMKSPGIFARIKSFFGF